MDWHKEGRILRRIFEMGIFNTILGFTAMILLIDVMGLKAWQYSLISMPIVLIAKYGYTKVRKIYNEE